MRDLAIVAAMLLTAGCDKSGTPDNPSAHRVVVTHPEQWAGAYFEAGFAMALCRSVIWTCREDHFKDTHFDTQQFNHILWKDFGTREELPYFARQE